LKLFVNDKIACQSDTIYGGDGKVEVDGKKWETISSYSKCREPIKLKAGDKVVLSSDYDLTKHRARPRSSEHGMEAEAMAVAFYRFAAK